MASRFIAALQPGERLEDHVFLIHSKDLRTTTQGSLYIHAILVDRTGQLVARQWQATEEGFAAMPTGGFLRFKGRVENYKGNLQFIIDAARPAEPGSFDLADFLPATDKDTEKMFARLVEILGGVKHADLVDLIGEFLADEKLMARFRLAPAAATMHHAYLGGLLEHTLSLMELAARVIPLYPKLSLDLVLTALFLHDIGKVEELTYETNIGYSNDGQLLGHITQATILIQRKADRLTAKRDKPFPQELLSVLQHIVLSHHGRYEFGSPKLPAIPEAIAVHHLDNLDAKIHMYLAEIENDRDAMSQWTNYHRALETKIYKPDVTGARGE